MEINLMRNNEIFTCVIVDEGAEDDGAVVVSRTCEHYMDRGHCAY